MMEILFLLIKYGIANQIPQVIGNHDPYSNILTEGISSDESDDRKNQLLQELWIHSKRKNFHDDDKTIASSYLENLLTDTHAYNENRRKEDRRYNMDKRKTIPYINNNRRNENVVDDLPAVTIHRNNNGSPVTHKPQSSNDDPNVLSFSQLEKSDAWRNIMHINQNTDDNDRIGALDYNVLSQIYNDIFDDNIVPYDGDRIFSDKEIISNNSTSSSNNNDILSSNQNKIFENDDNVLYNEKNKSDQIDDNTSKKNDKILSSNDSNQIDQNILSNTNNKSSSDKNVISNTNDNTLSSNKDILSNNNNNNNNNKIDYNKNSKKNHIISSSDKGIIDFFQNENKKVDNNLSYNNNIITENNFISFQNNNNVISYNNKIPIIVQGDSIIQPSLLQTEQFNFRINDSKVERDEEFHEKNNITNNNNNPSGLKKIVSPDNKGIKKKDFIKNKNINKQSKELNTIQSMYKNVVSKEISSIKTPAIDDKKILEQENVASSVAKKIRVQSKEDVTTENKENKPGENIDEILSGFVYENKKNGVKNENKKNGVKNENKKNDVKNQNENKESRSNNKNKAFKKIYEKGNERRESTLNGDIDSNNKNEKISGDIDSNNKNEKISGDIDSNNKNEKISGDIDSNNKNEKINKEKHDEVYKKDNIKIKNVNILDRKGTSFQEDENLDTNDINKKNKDNIVHSSQINKNIDIDQKKDQDIIAFTQEDSFQSEKNNNSQKYNFKDKTPHQIEIILTDPFEKLAILQSDTNTLERSILHSQKSIIPYKNLEEIDQRNRKKNKKMMELSETLYDDTDIDMSNDNEVLNDLSTNDNDIFLNDSNFNNFDNNDIFYNDDENIPQEDNFNDISVKEKLDNDSLTQENFENIVEQDNINNNHLLEQDKGNDFNLDKFINIKNNKLDQDNRNNELLQNNNNLNQDDDDDVILLDSNDALQMKLLDQKILNSKILERKSINNTIEISNIIDHEIPFDNNIIVHNNSEEILNTLDYEEALMFNNTDISNDDGKLSFNQNERWKGPALALFNGTSHKSESKHLVGQPIDRSNLRLSQLVNQEKFSNEQKRISPNEILPFSNNRNIILPMITKLDNNPTLPPSLQTKSFNLNPRLDDKVLLRDRSNLSTNYPSQLNLDEYHFFVDREVPPGDNFTDPFALSQETESSVPTPDPSDLSPPETESSVPFPDPFDLSLPEMESSVRLSPQLGSGSEERSLPEFNNVPIPPTILPNIPSILPNIQPDPSAYESEKRSILPDIQPASSIYESEERSLPEFNNGPISSGPFIQPFEEDINPILRATDEGIDDVNGTFGIAPIPFNPLGMPNMSNPFSNVNPGMLAGNNPSMIPQQRMPDMIPQQRMPDMIPQIRMPDMIPQQRMPDMIPQIRMPDMIPQIRNMPDMIPQIRNMPDMIPQIRNIPMNRPQGNPPMNRPQGNPRVNPVQGNMPTMNRPQGNRPTMNPNPRVNPVQGNLPKNGQQCPMFTVTNVRGYEFCMKKLISPNKSIKCCLPRKLRRGCDPQVIWNLHNCSDLEYCHPIYRSKEVCGRIYCKFPQCRPPQVPIRIGGKCCAECKDPNPFMRQGLLPNIQSPSGQGSRFDPGLPQFRIPKPIMPGPPIMNPRHIPTSSRPMGVPISSRPMGVPRFPHHPSPHTGSFAMHRVGTNSPTQNQSVQRALRDLGHRQAQKKFEWKLPSLMQRQEEKNLDDDISQNVSDDETKIKVDGMQDTDIDTTMVQNDDMQNTDIDTTMVQNDDMQNTDIDTTMIQNDGMQNTDFDAMMVQNDGMQNTDFDAMMVQNDDMQNTDIDAMMVQNDDMQNTDIDAMMVQNDDMQNTDFDATMMQNDGIPNNDINAIMSQRLHDESLINDRTDDIWYPDENNEILIENDFDIPQKSIMKQEDSKSYHNNHNKKDKKTYAHKITRKMRFANFIKHHDKQISLF